MSNKHRVLVVDDSLFAQKVVTGFLDGSDFEVVATAKTGADAVEQFKQCQPEIVLLDVILPDLNGPEALAAIMEIDASAKVLMVSSLGTEETVTECLTIGAKNFVQKPVDKDALLRHMQELLQS